MVTACTTSPSSDELRDLTTHDIALIVLQNNLNTQIRPHIIIQEHRQDHKRNNEPDIEYLLS